MVSRSHTLAQAEHAGDDALPTLDDAYRSYLPYVSKLAFRLLGGGPDLDDLIQDVFVAVAERLPHLRDPGALKSWLAAITVRVAQRKHLQRRLRNWLLFASEDPANERWLAVPSDEASVEARAALTRVFRTLDRAPIKDRIAWSLRLLEDEPLERVAELCNCSLATAKRRIASAQRLLEQELGHEH